MFKRITHKTKPIALLIAGALMLANAACSDALHAQSDPPTTPQAAPPVTQSTTPPAPTLAANAITQQTGATLALNSLPASVVYGDYAVGTRIGFAVDNSKRFDPWNSAYASQRYRDMLRRVEASGQTRTVIFQMWYPTYADTVAGRQDGPRSTYPADDRRHSRVLDSALQAGSSIERKRMESNAIALPQSSTVNATPAEGKFPLIILSHGLGGHHSMWTTFAEFLASHGYVVAAPTFISDGSNPRVFDDEDSPFANSATPAEVRQAYAVITGEGKVIPNFSRFMFANGKIVPGGIERATTMMQNLFRQRVEDVGLLAHTMRMLGKESRDCRASLRSMGATSAARDLCGFLDGRIDGARVGLSGHSLGSMTAQLGINHLSGISAAMGFNNAPPFTWTPEEMYGAGETADGLPVGSRKPTLIMIGDEDAFVQGIFIRLFQTSVARAGGDPSTAFPLEAERALPYRINNPQPVALSAYQRATSDRIFAIVRDVDHDILVSNGGRNGSCPEFQSVGASLCASPQRNRKPTGEAAFKNEYIAGERYTLLGWARLGDGSEAYMPHVIRDWYARAWFDWYLKDDEDAHRRLKNDDPFGNMTSILREVR